MRSSIDSQPIAVPGTQSPQLLQVANPETVGLCQVSPEPTRGFLSHRHIPASDSDIAWWACHYLNSRIGHSSPLTHQAKARDLKLFIEDFTTALGASDVSLWGTSQTQMFLWRFRQQGRAPASVNRMLSTLRCFAAWLQTQQQSPIFERGLPTQGVQALPLEEPACKKLEIDELTALFAAAEAAVHSDIPTSRLRPRRDQAMLGVLLHTGLRVGEMLSLTVGQYQGDRLVQVRRKGGGITDFVYLARAGRQWLDKYLAYERRGDDDAGPKGKEPLFTTPDGRALARGTVGYVFSRLAVVASAGRTRRIAIHPNLLRHTFGAAYRQASGSDTETAAALGHTALKHVSRYSRLTEAKKAEAMENIFQPRSTLA